MKEKRQICKKWLFVIAAIAILFALMATSCSQSGNSSQPNTVLESTASEPAVSQFVNVDWNMSDPNATTNGNIKKASDAILLVKSSDLKNQSKIVDPADVVASPSKYYGKFIKLTGKLLSDRTYAKISNIATQLGLDEVQELSIQTDNGTCISSFNISPVKVLKINDTISIYGYATGTMNSSKSSGEKLILLSFVGKAVEKQ